MRTEIESNPSPFILPAERLWEHAETLLGQPGIQVEIVDKRIDKTHALDNGSGVEILAQDDGNLIQSRRRPDLRILI